MKQSNCRASVRLGVVTLFAAVLAASCGGGGGSSSGAAPAPPPTPEPPASTLPSVNDFLSVGFSAASTGSGKTFLLVDPNRAPAVKQAISLANESTPGMFAAAAVSVDSASGTVTVYGSSLAFYAKNHQLFQVSLRVADNNAPQRISSLTDACYVNNWTPLSFDTSGNGWVAVTTSGADGDCATAADNQQVYVRSGASNNSAAIALPKGVVLIGGLPGPGVGSTEALLMKDSSSVPSKLVVYNTSMQRIGDVAGAPPADDFQLIGLTGSNWHEAYVYCSGAFWRLSWSITGAALSAPLYIITGFNGPPTPVTDGSALYFVKAGKEVHRIPSSGTKELLATLQTTSSVFLTLKGFSANYLIAQYYASDSTGTHVFALPKNGGSLIPLFNNVLASVLGTHDDTLLYSIPLTGSNGYELRQINADGTHGQSITKVSCVQPSPVYKRTYPFGKVPSIDAVTWVEPAAGDADCRNGTLRSLDLASGVTTTLGQFSNANASSFALDQALSFTDMPILIEASASVSSGTSRPSDMYYARVGQGNSLVRLSTQIP